MRVEIIGGFLGWGKTTAILNLLEAGDSNPARTVLLVNEFGEVGVDGGLLEGKGGTVSELTSGCICCSLRADFIGQIEELARQYEPERLIVEPSGIASMRDILQGLSQPPVAQFVDEIRTVLVLDVSDYEYFTHMSPTFVESQIGLAQVILLNKTDLAEEDVPAVQADLEERNPFALMIPTTYGRFAWEDVEGILPPLPSSAGPAASLEGYEVVAKELDGTFDQARLESVFSDLAEGRYGEVVRAKGVFEVGQGECLRADLASGRVRIGPWSCAGRTRINVIGHELDRAALDGALTQALAGAA